MSWLYPIITLLTSHDNIITTRGNEGLILKLMQQEIVRWTGYKPKVESKELVPKLITKPIVSTCVEL